MTASVPDSNFECIACNKCYMCRKYLNLTNSFSSFHTNQIFRLSSNISCKTEGLIYVIDCISCKVSYVGYTTGKMVVRLSNDKSHIKKGKKTCEITKHFIEHDHNLDFSTVSEFDNSLSKHLKVTLIEDVPLADNLATKCKEEICQKRETFWQTQLKCFTRYGGLNKRNNKKYEKT